VYTGTTHSNIFSILKKIYYIFLGVLNTPRGRTTNFSFFFFDLTFFFFHRNLLDAALDGNFEDIAKLISADQNYPVDLLRDKEANTPLSIVARYCIFCFSRFQHDESD
jgi:hypothetical protein